MKLSFDQIKSAAHGVSYCEEKDGKIYFHRFNRDLEKFYHKAEPAFDCKLLAAAGVSLRFITDSTTLLLSVDTERGSTRTYFSHDVFVNGTYYDSLANFEKKDMAGNYSVGEFRLGRYEKIFSLPAGTKEITVLFPALVCSALCSLELDDGASFSPVRCEKKLLALGDSITQGYDCAYPQNRYTYRTAESLGLSEHNLAIGADVFRPGAADFINEKNVSVITVAYGSNDWNGLPWEKAKYNCEKYFEKLAATMPGVPVYVLSPVWRKDCDRVTEYGSFDRVENLLRDICGKYPCFTFVRGFDFVPHDTDFFGDCFLHPNDRGFACYADALIKAVKK